jgi:hypothetical protein
MPNSEGDLDLLRDWNSSQISLALHSEGQDVILVQISSRFNFEKNITWSLLRKLGIPIWLKSEFKLNQLIESVAKNEYKLAEGTNGQSKAETCALWYVLTKKLSILQKLFNVEQNGKKFAEFIGSDFTQPKPKIVAGKNAMALVSKKKYTLACSFFLLAQDLNGACQVAIERCKDPVLAVLMCRIQDPNNETKALDKVVETYFTQRGTKFNDPYIRSLGKWLLKDFVVAVNEL